MLARIFLIGIAVVILSFAPMAYSDIQGNVSAFFWQTNGEHKLDGNNSDPFMANSWKSGHSTDAFMASTNAYLFEVNYDQLVAADLSFYEGYFNGQNESTSVYNSAGTLTDYSYAKADGRTRYANLGLYYRILGVDAESFSKLDIGTGYIGYSNNVDYNKPTIVLDSVAITNNGRTLNERLQNYSITYKGVDGRIREELNFSKTLSLDLMVGYTTGMQLSYYATQYPDRGSSQQKQSHFNADGTAIHYQAKLNYFISDHFSVSLGYKYLQLKVNGKSLTNVYPMWSGTTVNLENTIKGPIFGATYHF